MTGEEIKTLEETIEHYEFIIRESKPEDVLAVADALIRYKMQYKELTGKNYVTPERDDGI